MCCQKEGMELWDSPFGNNELLGLAVLYCWWRVICDLRAVWEREKEAQLRRQKVRLSHFSFLLHQAGINGASKMDLGM